MTVDVAGCTRSGHCWELTFTELKDGDRVLTVENLEDVIRMLVRQAAIIGHRCDPLREKLQDSVELENAKNQESREL